VQLHTQPRLFPKQNEYMAWRMFAFRELCSYLSRHSGSCDRPKRELGNSEQGSNFLRKLVNRLRQYMQADAVQALRATFFIGDNSKTMWGQIPYLYSVPDEGTTNLLIVIGNFSAISANSPNPWIDWYSHCAGITLSGLTDKKDDLVHLWLSTGHTNVLPWRQHR
jgi:hypothetical protein